MVFVLTTSTKFDSFHTLWLGWNDLLTLLLWQGYQAENLVFHFIQGSKFVYVGIEASMHLNPDKTFFYQLFNFKCRSTGISAESSFDWEEKEIKKENHLRVPKEEEKHKQKENQFRIISSPSGLVQPPTLLADALPKNHLNITVRLILQAVHNSHAINQVSSPIRQQ